MGIDDESAISAHHNNRRRGKTFSGCWTCRHRRLKCDERRPSCKRCRVAGLQCEGYGIRLVWTAKDNGSREDTSKQRSNRRSQLDPVSSLSSAPMSRAQVHGIQRNLQSTTHQNQLDQTSEGLFSVFASNLGTQTFTRQANSDVPRANVDTPSSTRDTPASQQICVADYPAQIQFELEDVVQNPFLAGCSAIGIENDSSHDEVEVEVETPQTNLAISQQTTTLWPICDFPAARHPTTPRSLSMESQLSPAKSHRNNSATQIVLQDLPEAPNGIQKRSSHLELFSTPSDHCELIQHWMTTLSPSMNPVVQDQEETSLLTTMALDGINSDAESSSGGIAVFHGICAASAFHLSNLQRDPTRFTKMAMTHRDLALSHLRRSMRNDEHIKDESVWAAIWTFLFQEGICGRPREWRTHLEGLRSLILADPCAVNNSSIARAVYQSYICIAILGNFQLDDTMDKLLSQVPPNLDYIEPVHGLTRNLLEIILKINTTAASKTSSFSVISDRIKLQLLLYSPGAIAVAGLNQQCARLLVHYSHIYYYATVIHFQRQLLKTHPRLLQDLVKLTIEHLEAVEASDSHPLGCIWTWPCLVVVVECNEPALQVRMLAWIESKRRHGFIGLEIAGALAREVWHRRSTAPDQAAEINWQDIIEGSIYDILPL